MKRLLLAMMLASATTLPLSGEVISKAAVYEQGGVKLFLRHDSVVVGELTFQGAHRS